MSSVIQMMVDSAVPVAPDAHDWPELTPIKADLPDPPPFNAQALLPRHLADFVLDESDRMCAPPDFLAATLMVCLGSAIGARCSLRPKRRDDWIVTPNLFGAVVGEPSSRKSPACGAAIRFLERLEVREAEHLEGQKRTFEAEMAAFDAREGAIKAALKKAAGGKSDEAKMDAAIADLANLEKPQEPTARRFKINDGTIEKIGDILARNPEGLLVYRDELIGLLAGWDREGHEGDRSFYLEGFNGTGSFNIERIGRGSLFVPQVCLSVFGGIQPDILKRYLLNVSRTLDNDGRIQRFQLLVFPKERAWKWVDRYPVKEAREYVRDVFDRLASFDPQQDGASPANEFVKLPFFSFDDAAQDVFIEWSRQLHGDWIPAASGPFMAQHLAKYEQLFCAVALILHCAVGDKGPVRSESALRAAAWTAYLKAHAERVYALAGAARVDTAQALSDRIKAGKLEDGFTARDVVRKGWAGLTTAADAEAALAVLEEHGWVMGNDTGGDGRPTTRYFINPKARGRK